jgi:hypothetical protein
MPASGSMSNDSDGRAADAGDGRGDLACGEGEGVGKGTAGVVVAIVAGGAPHPTTIVSAISDSTTLR